MAFYSPFGVLPVHGAQVKHRARVRGRRDRQRAGLSTSLSVLFCLVLKAFYPPFYWISAKDFLFALLHWISAKGFLFTLVYWISQVRHRARVRGRRH